MLCIIPIWSYYFARDDRAKSKYPRQITGHSYRHVSPGKSLLQRIMLAKNIREIPIQTPDYYFFTCVSETELVSGVDLVVTRRSVGFGHDRIYFATYQVPFVYLHSYLACTIATTTVSATASAEGKDYVATSSS